MISYFHDVMCRNHVHALKEVIVWDTQCTLLRLKDVRGIGKDVALGKNASRAACDLIHVYYILVNVNSIKVYNVIQRIMSTHMIELWVLLINFKKAYLSIYLVICCICRIFLQLYFHFCLLIVSSILIKYFKTWTLFL